MKSLVDVDLTTFARDDVVCSHVTPCGSHVSQPMMDAGASLALGE